MNIRTILLIFVLISFSSLYAVEADSAGMENNEESFYDEEFSLAEEQQEIVGVENGQGKKKEIFVPESPFRDIDHGYFSEKLRKEKIIIAVGAVTMAVGLPLLLAGVLPLVSPNTDFTERTLATQYALIGIGSGFLGLGGGITIAGSISFAIGRKKLAQQNSEIEATPTMDEE